MKQKSETTNIGSTPHFQSNIESDLKDDDKNKNSKISEFQTDDLDTSKNNNDSFKFTNSYLNNSYNPNNPLSSTPDKSFDNLNNNSQNGSIISENKLQSYAQKTKILNKAKMESFKSLNFKKQKNIEEKYEEEYSNIDDKSKAAFNSNENISSSFQKISSNKFISEIKGMSNPFNISNKINKFQKNSNIPENNNNNKDDANYPITDRYVGSESIYNNHNFSKNKINNDQNLKYNILTSNSKSNKNDNQTKMIIDNKLRSLVTDRKIIESKVLKTGSLLSLLNFGIKSNSILICSKINVTDVK